MTPEQQTALQQILKEHSDVTGQIEEAINAKRGELLAQLDSTNPDRAKLPAFPGNWAICAASASQPALT